MNFFLRVLAATYVLMFSTLPATADDFPKKLSEFEGWHGATIKKEGDVCTLVFPRNFGKSASELKLLREVANHSDKPKLDLNCMLQANYAAWDQLRRLAIEDQNRAAAEMIIFAHDKGGLRIEGEFADLYGDTYLFPVLLGYKKLADIIPPKKESGVATNICLTYYNPSSNENLDFEGLMRRLAADNMQSLIRKVKSECARIEKEVNGSN